jgi:molecular chaperone GrpE (heat shock protein)
MLDLVDELKKYSKIETAAQSLHETDENKSDAVIDVLHDDIDRISKALFKLEQFYENIAEEIHEFAGSQSVLQESHNNALKYKDNIIKDMYRQLSEYNVRAKGLLGALFEISDKMDIVYSYAGSLGDEKWKSQLAHIKNDTDKILLSNGIVETGNEEYFDDVLHDAVAAVEDEEKGYHQIVDVERKGYLYNGKVYRKAKVIVNTYRKEENKKWGE